MPIKKSQQSFSGGELSPSLHNRIDLAKYQNSLDTCKNSFPRKHGGVSNRPGFQFIGEVKDSSVVTRLIPFKFNTDQTYALEFGNLTLRVVADGAYVIDSSSPPDIYELIIPYAEADLPLLKFTQSADVMTITHPDYDPRELSRTAHDVWSISTISFGPILAAPTGGQIDSTKISVQKAIVGITNATEAFVNVVAHTMLSGDKCVIKDVVGMTEVNDREFIIRYFDADNFYLVGEDSTSYGVYVVSAVDDVFPNVGYQNYKIVGINDDTKELTLPLTITSDHITFPLSDTVHNRIQWTAALGCSKYDIYKEDNGFYGYIGTASGTSFLDNNISADYSDSPQEEQDPFSGTDNRPSCVTYHEQRRIFGRTNNKRQTVFGTQTGNQSNMNVSFFTKDSDAFEFTIASRLVNEIRHLLPATDLISFTSGGVWKMSGGQFAISPSNILVENQSNAGCSDTVAPILAGDYILYVEDGDNILNEINFSLERNKYSSIDRTLLASHLFEDDSIKEIVYARKPESIIWCVMTSGKLLGMTYIPDQDVWGWHQHDTDGIFESICSILEGDEDAVYVVVKRTINGSTKRYVERLHTRVFSDVRDCFFVDSGLSLDLPVLISGATKANPCVMTTTTSHGFSNGDYVDINNVVGMLELNKKQFKIKNVTSATFELTNSSDVNIDSNAYSSYASGGDVRKAVTSISGLDHLEGKTVSVLANGNVVSPDPVVTSGAITLPNPSSRVHVGLSYVSDIGTLDIDTIDGRMNAKKINVNDVQVRLLKSRGMWVGPSADKLTEWKQRGLSGEDYGEATELFTGLAKLGTTAVWRDGGGTLIRQQYPLPITVLSIIPKVSLGG